MTKDDKRTHVIGKFADSTVFVDGLFGKDMVESTEFGKPFHDVTHRGHTYRFVDPDQLSEESVATLAAQPNSFVFEGDLSEVYLTISRRGIRAEHFPLYDQPEA